MRPGARDLDGFNDAQLAAQARARDLAARLLAPGTAARDRSEGFPTEALLGLGEAGLMGVNLPADLGGRAAGAVGYALAVRELAAACAGTAVGMMVTNMVAEAIDKFGDDAQRRRWIPRITKGEWPAAGFSLSEPDAGSDAGGLKATAVRRGDHYVLDGTKSWVTSGGHAGLYLVMASTDPAARTRGISAFLVPATAPGLTATKPEDKMGLRSSATTQLVLEGVRVPVADRLGPEGIGFKVAMNALDGGRVGVSAQACGIATAAFELLLDVARREGVAGREALLADSAAELEAGWLMCLRAARMKDAGVRFSKEAAMTKLYCSEMAGRVCERALQAHGTAGELAAAERLLRDTRINRIYEGTSEVQRLVIAREVLRGVG
ncbi:MAG: acyl-CoA dehydrogenase family protein [Myxococcales bacterium]|nr:acyl-CoA dehydrogenase family protein [Myxococcales bacterium]